MKQRALYLFGIVALALSLFMGLTGSVGAQMSWREFWNDVRVRGRLLVDSTSIFQDNVSMLEALDVTGDLSAGGNFTLTGDLTVDDLTVGGTLSGATLSGAILETTVITVTTDGEVDCSDGGLKLLTAAGNVQTSDITTTTVEGIRCLMVNEANVTITFTETGALRLSGNAALGQYDTLELISVNSEWIEHAQNNN